MSPVRGQAAVVLAVVLILLTVLMRSNAEAPNPNDVSNCGDRLYLDSIYLVPNRSAYRVLQSPQHKGFTRRPLRS